MSTNEYMAQWRAKKKSESICTTCGVHKTETFAQCKACHDRMMKYNNQRIKKRQLEGKCINCGNPSGDKWRCRECQEKVKISKRHLIVERRKAGICERCGGENAIINPLNKSCFCEVCLFKIFATRTFGSAAFWKKLADLLSSQPTCPYTGKELKIGINASVDHIVPKSKGGTNDTSNLQWVYCYGSYDINSMKNNMSDQEFKDSIADMFMHLHRGD